MKTKTYVIGIASTLILLPMVSHADVRFNGFASIRATTLDSDGPTSPFNTLQGNGDISFKDESLFALQASADLGEGLTATVQLMAEGVNDFDVEARWAYLSYHINDTHRVSAGRLANPIFSQSEYEKVGYAHNFARLPKAVYIGMDFSTVEGISLDSSFPVGDYTLETKLLYGNWDGAAYSPITLGYLDYALKDILSARVTFSGDWWTIFAGGFSTELDGGEIDTFVSSLAAGGVAAAEGAGATAADVNAFNDALAWTGDDGLYLYAGFSVDNNNWLVDFEYSDYGVQDSSAAIQNAWYAALGYRFDNMIVTVHTEDYEQKADTSFLSSVQHPILIGTGQALHGALTNRSFDGSGITLRYDFHDSAALKFDYFSGEDIRPNIGDYTIMSVGIDLVF